MARLILALAMLGLAHPVWAQNEDWRDIQREEAREARDRAREAREAAREAQREAREEARDARREAWEGVRDRDGVHLRLLRSYRLPAGSVSREPIVVVGGSATIDGRAEKDVVVIGGSLRVGPQAVILGDAVSVGGNVIVDPAATIEGEIDETLVTWPDFDIDWAGVPNGWWAAASLGAVIVRLGLALFVSLLITWIAPGWTGNIGARASEAPGASLFVGLTSQLLFVPAVILLTVVLIISIVGIPLLLAMPFLLAFAALAWTAGFAGVTARLGARLRGQRPDASTSPTVDLIVGFAVVSLITVVAHFVALGPWFTKPVSLPLMLTGWLIEWIVWTIGLGAMMTSYLGRRSMAPPAIPIIPRPAPSEM